MKKVLVIDDDDIFRSYLEELLELSGFDVLSASNGSSGLAAVDECSPDVVVTDLVMPDMEGLEVIKTLFQKNRNLPVIAMSGGNCGFGASYLKIAEKFGARAVFDKPFEVEEFVDVVKKFAGE